MGLAFSCDCGGLSHKEAPSLVAWLKICNIQKSKILDI